MSPPFYIAVRYIVALSISHCDTVVKTFFLSAVHFRDILKKTKRGIPVFVPKGAAVLELLRG